MSLTRRLRANWAFVWHPVAECSPVVVLGHEKLAAFKLPDMIGCSHLKSVGVT